MGTARAVLNLSGLWRLEYAQQVTVARSARIDEATLRQFVGRLQREVTFVIDRVMATQAALLNDRDDAVAKEVIGVRGGIKEYDQQHCAN